MKKIVLAAAALSFAALAFAPVSASAMPTRYASVGYWHSHCEIVTTKVHNHGRLIVTTRKVCH